MTKYHRVPIGVSGYVVICSRLPLVAHSLLDGDLHHTGTYNMVFNSLKSARAAYWAWLDSDRHAARVALGDPSEPRIYSTYTMDDGYTRILNEVKPGREGHY